MKLDKRLERYVESVVTMMKWFASVILIVAVSGSITAGVQMHSGLHDSAMMDCCKTALGHDHSPQASAARLCCAINCPEPTPTGGSISYGPSQLPLATLHPATAHPVADLFHAQRHFTETQALSFSQPSYIRNLALLI